MGVQQEALLCEFVSVSMEMRDGDDREAHLACPRVHDASHVVFVLNRLRETFPQVLHVRVRKLVDGHVTLEQKTHSELVL